MGRPANEVLEQLNELQNNFKMKSIKLIFLSVAICIASIAIILQSCNNDVNDITTTNFTSKINTSSQYDYLDLPKVYQQIGQFHNESLDTIFTKINEDFYSSYHNVNTKGNLQKVQTSLKSLNYNSIIKNALLKYAKSNAVLNKNYSNCVQAANCIVKRRLVKGSADSTVVLDNLNSTQKEFMDSIRSALKANCQDLNLIGLKNKLDEINKDATRKLTKVDAICIYAATSVAYNSFQYWKQNIKKWGGLLTAYNIDNSKCKELRISGVRSLNKSKRFKSNYFELADGSYLLPEVSVYPYSVWSNTILPIINADCDAAAGSLAVSLSHAAYIELVSAGTATPAAIADIIIETSISAGGSSGYTALGLLTGWW